MAVVALLVIEADVTLFTDYFLTTVVLTTLKENS